MVYQSLVSDMQAMLISVIISILNFKAVSVLMLQRSESPERWERDKQRLKAFQIVFYSMYGISKIIMVVARIIRLTRIYND